ncbi:MAG: hypothetical protein IPH86_09925 [bacterium]|nr:hypothetical protein [bacterium]
MRSLNCWRLGLPLSMGPRSRLRANTARTSSPAAWAMAWSSTPASNGLAVREAKTS